MKRFIFSIFLFIWAAPSLGVAQEDQFSTLPVSLKEFIKNLEIEKQEWQGGAVAILHKGRVIYTTTFGNQKGKKGPITPDTLFPLASVSKSVSSMALALMIETKTTSLEKELKLPRLKNKVNLKNILSHTTGFFFRGDRQIEQGLTRPQLIEKLKLQKPQCKAGQCYFYSNMVFSLVEELLNSQKLSLKEAIKLLRNKLGTQDIHLLPLPPRAIIAYSHVKDKSKKSSPASVLPFPSYYSKAVPASAGIFASLNAMIEIFKLSFGYRPDLLSSQTLEEFQKPYSENKDIDNWSMQWPCPRNTIKSFYGLGWRILETSISPEKKLIFHSGYTAGVNSFIGYIPAEEIGIIILGNQAGFASRKGLEFWGIFVKPDV